MASAPYLGGGFGHFYAYAPVKIEYAIDRFAMEAKRQMDVLDRRLCGSPWLAGPEYTIADIITYPLAVVSVRRYPGNLGRHPHIARWASLVGQRPAVQRGMKVPS